jgi:CubicO group peptidase (beta-lactamase class C family)
MTAIAENAAWAWTPEFRPVVDVFLENFDSRGEVGAACAIYHHGEKVVDLWGGTRTDLWSVGWGGPAADWERDTLVLTYSLTKGMTGLCIAHAVAHGWLDYTAPVASYWPEFRDAEVTVRDVMSEKVGLSALRRLLWPARMGDRLPIYEKLATQRRAWRANRRWGNHPHTIGWIASKLLENTAGETLGEYFAHHLAPPDPAADGEFYIRLDQANLARLARIDGWPFFSLTYRRNTYPRDMVDALLFPPSLTFRSLANPFATNAECMDRWAYHQHENGGAGGVGNARALAEIYGQFAIGGGRFGIDTATINALEGPAPVPERGVRDTVLKTDVYYSLGLEKPFYDFNFGASPAAYGTFAVGGGMAYADPARGIGYAYVTNKLGTYRWADPRSLMIRQALDEIVRPRQGG